ncbi:hypothetical protein EDD86DRAFT_204196 [Gorgonomyces haynaldii]|nr:hypothetical protein EDD86DRAFT_204196 [Gorgonomyces haynaldii]
MLIHRLENGFMSDDTLSSRDRESAFKRLLQRLPGLKSLDYSHGWIPTNDYRLFEACAHLECLSLNGISLETLHSQRIFQYLAHIKCLHLSDCFYEGLSGIEALRDVESLDISGTDHMEAALLDTDLIAISKMISNTRIKYLDMGCVEEYYQRVHYSSDAIQQLGEAFHQSHLEHLGLSGFYLNNCTDQLLSQLPLHTLRVLDLSETFATDHLPAFQTLETLILYRCDLTSLKSLMASFSSLKSLSLARNRLSHDAITMLLNALPSSHLERLNLSHVPLNDTQLSQLLAHVQSTSIYSLILEGISFKDCRLLIDCLEIGKLSHLAIGDTDCPNLVDAILNSSLQVLEIGRLHGYERLFQSRLKALSLRSVAFDSLMECIQSTQLLDLDLSDNRITETTIEQLHQTLMSSSLEFFTLTQHKDNRLCYLHKVRQLLEPDDYNGRGWLRFRLNAYWHLRHPSMGYFL